MDINNLEPSERVVEVRESNTPEIIIYEVAEIKKHFDENMRLLENQFQIADGLVRDGKVADAETIWRTQVVLLASTFDFFMHEIVWLGLNQMFKGQRTKTDRYNKLTVTMKELEDFANNPEGEKWFNGYITSMYKSATMISFGDVKRYLSIIDVSVQRVADRAFHQIGGTVKTIKQIEEKLNRIYYRRNSIAHQSDRAHEDAVQKPITKELVGEFIEIVNKIVSAIIDEASIV